MKKMKVLILLLITILVISACTSTNGQEISNEKEDTVTKLTFGMMPSDSSAPIVVAEKLGYFEEVDIDIDLQLFFSAKDRDSALHSGNLDGADYDLITAITSISNGSEFKVAYKSNGDFKLVSPNTTFDTIKDKSVGLSKNTIIEYYVDKVLESNLVDLSDINKEIIPQIPVRLQMLEAGKLDMALLPDPLASLAIVNGSKLLANSSDYGENVGAFIFTDAYTKENPEAVERFAKAYDKAAKFIDENENSKYIDYLISDLGFPKPVSESLDLVEFGVLKTHEKETVAEVISWLKDKELLENDISYGEIVID